MSMILNGSILRLLHVVSCSNLALPKIGQYLIRWSISWAQRITGYLEPVKVLFVEAVARENFRKLKRDPVNLRKSGLCPVV